MKVLHAADRTDDASGIMTFVSRLDAALRDVGVDSSVSFGLGDFAVSGCDVVHLHGLWTPWLHGAFRMARRQGKHVVWSTHGMTAPWAMRHKAWKKLPYWWLRQRRDLASADAVHSTSALEGEWNRRAVGEKARHFVVPVGTDERPSPAAPHESRVVLFVGRLHPVKGLENLIRAFAAFASRNGNAVLRLVGPDEDGYLAKLKSLAAMLGVAERVETTGKLSGADLSRQYDECAVLVLPSFTENFGAVVADALAHGKCAIASRFTPWGVLEERKCGWWVENSPEALAAAMEEAFDAQEKGELPKMGERALALAAERFSWPSIARAMAENYNRLASCR